MSDKIKYNSCPLCDQVGITKQFDIKDFSISKEGFEIWDCEICKFRFTQNAPSQTDAGPYYESEDYVSHSDNKEGLIHKLYHIARNYMLKSKRNLIVKHVDGRKLLDIGTGTGYFLGTMKKAGFDVKGIEINEEARKYAKDKFSVEVVPPIDFESDNLDSKFNVVTMWHVLEHVYDIHGYISKISDVLLSDGHLVIAVPNYKSYDGSHYKKHWAGYDVPRHLWHFVVDDIKFIADKHGFELVAKKRMPLDSFYVSLLSEKHLNSKLSLFKGFYFGMISWLNSLFSIDNCSSVIYILKKNT